MTSSPGMNPYLPPSAALEPEVLTEAADAPLANLWQRYGGALVDAIANFGVPQIILYVGVTRGEAISVWAGGIVERYLRQGPWGYAAGAVALAVVVVQWFLIASRGQSLGKMLARTRIVRRNGAPLGFLHGVVLRNWFLSVPFLVMPLLKFSGDAVLSKLLGGIALVDVLLIFGASRRCLHDQIAGTKVIQVPANEASREAR
jgi:uncharacterized RDD family membrane protein YckC